jgi:hypothetical protein
VLAARVRPQCIRPRHLCALTRVHLQAIAAREREEKALETIRAKVDAAYQRQSVYALPLRP